MGGRGPLTRCCCLHQHVTHSRKSERSESKIFTAPGRRRWRRTSAASGWRRAAATPSRIGCSRSTTCTAARRPSWPRRTRPGAMPSRRSSSRSTTRRPARPPPATAATMGGTGRGTRMTHRSGRWSSATSRRTCSRTACRTSPRRPWRTTTPPGARALYACSTALASKLCSVHARGFLAPWEPSEVYSWHHTGATIPVTRR